MTERDSALTTTASPVPQGLPQWPNAAEPISDDVPPTMPQLFGWSGSRMETSPRQAEAVVTANASTLEPGRLVAANRPLLAAAVSEAWLAGTAPGPRGMGFAVAVLSTLPLA